MLRVLTIGTFDLLHSGHINLFRRIKKLFPDSYLIVAVNPDWFVEQYKRKPFMPYSERVAVLKACRYIDEVVENSGGSNSRFAIVNNHANIIVHGDDWVGPTYLSQLNVTQEWLDKNQIQLVYLPYTANISTTKLYENINTNTNH